MFAGSRDAVYPCEPFRQTALVMFQIIGENVKHGAVAAEVERGKLLRLHGRIDEKGMLDALLPQARFRIGEHLVYVGLRDIPVFLRNFPFRVGKADVSRMGEQHVRSEMDGGRAHAFFHQKTPGSLRFHAPAASCGFLGQPLRHMAFKEIRQGEQQGSAARIPALRGRREAVQEQAAPGESRGVVCEVSVLAAGEEVLAGLPGWGDGVKSVQKSACGAQVRCGFA